MAQQVLNEIWVINSKLCFILSFPTKLHGLLSFAMQFYLTRKSKFLLFTHFFETSVLWTDSSVLVAQLLPEYVGIFLVYLGAHWWRHITHMWLHCFVYKNTDLWPLDQIAFVCIFSFLLNTELKFWKIAFTFTTFNFCLTKKNCW